MSVHTEQSWSCYPVWSWSDLDLDFTGNLPLPASVSKRISRNIHVPRGYTRRSSHAFPHWLGVSSGNPSQLTILYNTRSYLRIISQPERQESWERANTSDRARKREGGLKGADSAEEKEDIPLRLEETGPFQRDSWTRKGEHDVALLYKIRARQVPATIRFKSDDTWRGEWRDKSKWFWLSICVARSCVIRHEGIENSIDVDTEMAPLSRSGCYYRLKNKIKK